MDYRVLINWTTALGRWGDKLSRDNPRLLEIERRLQPDGFSCGAYSALMILEYYGKARSSRAVARALGTDEDGTSQQAIIDLFRQRGLSPRIDTHATLRDLRRAVDEKAPVLVSVNNGGHWSVVYGYSREKIYLADPSIFKKWWGTGMANKKFREIWDRWAMVIRKTVGSGRRASNRKR